MVQADRSGVRVYPPIFFAGGVATGFLVQKMWPLGLGGPAVRPAVRAAGFVALSLWILFDGWAILALLRRNTSPNPMKPTTALVTEGPYRLSRNPIYLGYVFLQAGIALLADSLWPLLTLPVVIVLVRRVVIDREERYLETKFGEAYRQYKARVRRWI
jgi:protein-S-isoprenylcysteine O-methyltransferase Ste14